MTENTVQNTADESKKAKTANTIETNISENRKLVETILNTPEILAAIKKFNYTEDFLLALLILIDQTSDAQAAQKQEKGESKTAVTEFQNLKEEAYETYSEYRTLSRHIFKNDETAYKSLRLNETRKQAFSAWSEEAIQFYKNALGSESIKNQFAENGITEKLLKYGEAKLLKTLEYKINADKEKSEAITATEERDKKIEEMNESVSKLKAFAKFALKGSNDLKRRLGL